MEVQPSNSIFVSQFSKRAIQILFQELNHLRLRTQPRHHTPHLLDISPEAAILEHLVQPRSAKTRMRLQRLAHQGKISIQHRGPQTLGAMKALDLDGAFYRIGMNTERFGNRAHLPVFGMKVAADLYPHLRIDHLSLIGESI